MYDRHQVRPYTTVNVMNDELETIADQQYQELTHPRTEKKSLTWGEFLRYTDKVKILSNAAARLKDNPYRGNLIGVGADFAKETQERRKALVPFKKHLQNKLGRERKVFIAYPAILKHLGENGNPKIVRDEDFKKLKGEMQEEEGR